MSGIRKLIYVKSQDVWEGVEASAKLIDRSVSWYLLECHRRCKEIDDEISRAVNRGEIASVGPEPEKDDPVPDESTYDPGEVADTPSSVPEVEKPVSENPKKKATVKKLQADIDGSKWGNAGKDFSKGAQANRGKGKKKGG